MIYEEVLQISKKNIDYKIEKWARNLSRHFTKWDIQMANKSEHALNLLVIREKQVKTPMNYKNTFTKVAKIF